MSYWTVLDTEAASTRAPVCVTLGGLDETVLSTRVSTSTTAAVEADVLDQISASVTVAGYSPTAEQHPVYYRITAPIEGFAHYRTCE